ELLVYQEELLLRPQRGQHPSRLRAQQLQRTAGLGVQRLHRAQKRCLVIQRVTGPRGEGGRNREVRTRGRLDDERRRGRVPGGVAARLEGRAQAARGERRGVGLALDEVLARELGHRAPTRVGRDERVVL